VTVGLIKVSTHHGSVLNSVVARLDRAIQFTPFAHIGALHPCEERATDGSRRLERPG
jgi:hypothetical protein